MAIEKGAVGKGPYHTSVIGDFGEALAAYWLDRLGLEVLRADYVGLDLIAYDRKTKKRLGISVKSRSRRKKGMKNRSVTIFGNKGSERLLKSACKTFECEPWLAVYVETDVDAGVGSRRTADLYLTSLKHSKPFLRRQSRRVRGKTRITVEWPMTICDRKIYDKDHMIMHLTLPLDQHRWDLKIMREISPPERGR